MTPLALMEIVGFLSCCVGLWFVNQARSRLTSDGRLTLLLLLVLAGGTHFLDVLEWTDVEGADRWGDIFKIFTPAAWLFFLFVVRRDGLLREVGQQSEQLSFFFESTPMAIAVFDSNGRYVIASQRWLEMHSISADPKGFTLSQSSSLASRWVGILANIHSSSAPLSGLEQFTTGTQTTWLEWKARRLREGQTSGGCILLVDDVSERIKQDQTRESTLDRLSRQQNMETIGEIASGVAHDVNNLLQVISAHASSLESQHVSIDEFRESLDSIRDAVLSASGMTRWLLRQGKRDETHYAPIDLTILLDRVTHIISRAIPRSQRLVVVQPKTEISVLGNQTLIEQLVINLVLNARDAMSQGGEITVRLSLGACGGAQLEVCDQGHGIEENIRDRIMEPFFTTKGDRGTGMGLAVVHRVIVAHGAELQLSSSPGQGARFSVQFPDPAYFSPPLRADAEVKPAHVLAR